MSDHYYNNKKAHFKSNFGKDADSNLSDFLKYVSIEMNREILDSLSDLKMAIDNLTESNHNG
ncbi:hypothetical protein [Paucihalobacter sp.]|uniref:hypothetical protein n=1 Tax=Paucihalobacter sp. TaxID=2850405 RepID=UPI002FE13EF9